MPDQSKSLSDAEIRSTFNQNGQEYHATFVTAKKLYDNLQNQQGSAQTSISVDDLRKIVLTMFAMQKLLGESDPQLREAGGDRGANCDYNPFNKVNFLV